MIDYDSMKRGFGASPMDWDDAERLGLLEDLLPVVSNLAALISPYSKLEKVGKVPSRYNRAHHVVGIPKWTKRATTAAMLAAWKKQPDYGICIQTRRLRALDIDIRDAALSAAIVGAVCARLGIPRIPLRFRTGTGKCLLVFWLLADAEGDFFKQTFRVPSGEVIEFLATGEQYVAVATHESGQRYRNGDLDCLPDAEEIPTLTREQFEDLWDCLIRQFAVPGSEKRSNGSSRRDVAESAVTNDPVAMAFIDAGIDRGHRPDGGLNVHCPWEAEHSGDSGETEATYWPPHTRGYAHGGFKCLHAHCEKRRVADVRKFFGLSDGSQPHDAKRFHWWGVDQLLTQPRPTWWIKEVLPRNGLGMVYGEAGSGKSIFVYDMVLSLVNGTAWCGHKVTPARVAWIAAEGAGGHRNRTEAMDKERGITRGQLITLCAAPNLLDDQQTEELIAGILDAGGADILVVDTVAQTMPGADENSSTEWSCLMRHCERFREALGATVVLIHHSGKDPTKGPRGWSGQRGPLDMEILITRKDNDHEARITKMKDGEAGKCYPFKLRRIDLSIDDDGDLIKSVVVEHVSLSTSTPTPTAPKAKRGKEEKVYEVMVMMQPSDGTRRINIAEIIDTAYSHLTYDPAKRDRRRQTVKRTLEQMAKRGVIQWDAKAAWLP
jgi:KaiC/GvpD/RAD55 family RecA-like ATPase